MSKESIAEERLSRIKRAVALENVRRTPVVLEYSTFAARVTNTPMPEFLLDLDKSVTIMKQAYELVSEAAETDAVNYGSYSPYSLSYTWMSKVRVPGVDLPPDYSAQVVEEALVTRDDYDVILKEGWPEFYSNFMAEKVLVDVPRAYLASNQTRVDIGKEWAGVPVLSGSSVFAPIEYLCGGRSFANLAIDLCEIPDKVQAVLDEIAPHMCAAACRQARQKGCPTVWVGGWQAAPVLLSPKMWNRFVWPYLKRLVLEILEHELIPLLHLDSDWTRELERFRELPRAKAIMALDGDTDIFEAKRILGDHICLMGDVPPGMLCFSDPDTVFRYSAKLIEGLGPAGFILQSGCDIPENARLENVQAMAIAAAATATC